MIEALEFASLEAWPALVSEIYDGWVLRFSNGYTKRANSINILQNSTLSLREKVEACETAYRIKNLLPVFRITPLAPPELDIFLEEKGYQFIHPTWVVAKDIQNYHTVSERKSSFEESRLDDWLGIFGKLSQVPREKSSLQREIIALIRYPRLFAAIRDGRSSLACGLGVLTGRMFGLYDIIVHPSFRNQGYGIRLVEGMLDWAVSKHASIAYLQVMDENLPARGLYKKLGFQDKYQYWYRVPLS